MLNSDLVPALPSIFSHCMQIHEFLGFSDVTINKMNQILMLLLSFKLMRLMRLCALVRNELIKFVEIDSYLSTWYFQRDAVEKCSCKPDERRSYEEVSISQKLVPQYISSIFNQ